MEPLVFDNIVQATGDKDFGQLTVSPTELTFKSNRNKPRSYKKGSFGKLKWVKCGATCMLQVFLQKDGKFERFDGFKPKDYESLSRMFLEEYGTDISESKLSTFALNMGELNLSNQKNTLEIEFQSETVLEVPFSTISQCAVPGKNEIEIQFEDDDTGNKEDELLVQMRLHVPPTEEGVDTSEAVQTEIVSKAGIRGVVGDVICSLSEDIGSFLTPRGKYLIELYDKYLRMHGKTYNYKITYSAISKLFLLPNIYGTNFVISLKRPIQQGQQRYAHLVMQLSDKADVLDVNLSDEDIEKKYENQLSKKLEGPLPEIVARLFKTLSGKKVFIPGNFLSSDNLKCVKCALKASQGYLYPLNQSFFFIHKPATFIRYEDVEQIEFTRLDNDPANAAINRFFDLEITAKQSENVEGFASGEKYHFANLDKSELSNLFNFLKKKGLTIKNTSHVEESLKTVMNPPVSKPVAPTGFAAMEIAEESDSDDSDFDADQVELSSSSSESDDGDSGSDASDDEEDKKEKEEKKSKKRKEAPSKEESKPKKKKVAKKDPNYPKKAGSAYNFFFTEVNKQIKAENPELKSPEIMKMVSEKWKAVSASDKKKYEDLAKEDKERFNKEIAAYKPPEGYDKKGKKIE